MNNLLCAVCLLTNDQTEAITIANGQAVCDDHYRQIKLMFDQARGNLALSQFDFFREHMT